MNSQAKQNSALTSHPEQATHTHELLDEMSAQALEYAEREFGVGHPIWQSIHDQVACFCHCAESCADARKAGRRQPPRATH